MAFVFMNRGDQGLAGSELAWLGYLLSPVKINCVASLLSRNIWINGCIKIHIGLEEKMSPTSKHFHLEKLMCRLLRQPKNKK